MVLSDSELETNSSTLSYASRTGLRPQNTGTMFFPGSVVCLLNGLAH